MIDELNGVRVFVSDVPVGDDREAVQLIAQAHYDHQAEWMAFTPEQLTRVFEDLVGQQQVL